MKNIIKFIKKNKLVLLTILLSLTLYSPALGNFFSGDDWFHLKVIKISSINEFLNFFNPVANEQSTAFYRPIPNQLFFYIFYQLFKLNSFYYHLLVFIIFSVNLYLFYLLSKNLNIPKRASLIALSIFAFSHTNFSQLNFISAAQEIMMNLFVLLGLLTIFKKQDIRNFLFSGFYFALALLCKDNAIVFPALVIIFDWMKYKRFNLKRLMVLSFIGLVYLYVRIILFGFNSTLGNHESYDLSFSPVVTLNTIYTYILWAIGGAELLKDYLSSPVTLIQRYYSDFGILGKMMIGLLISVGSAVILITLKNIKKIKEFQIGAVVVFIISLSPVIFFPNHKFAMQMSLSMMGFSLFTGTLLARESKKVITLIIFLYLSLNISSIIMTQNTHYSVQRSKISSRAYKFFSEEYPTLQDNTRVIIANSDTSGSEIPTWGSSKQVSHALMMDNFFKVLYPGKNIEVIYEDLVESLPATDKSSLILDSKIFLSDSQN